MFICNTSKITHSIGNQKYQKYVLHTRREGDKQVQNYEMTWEQIHYTYIFLLDSISKVEVGRLVQANVKVSLLDQCLFHILHTKRINLTTAYKQTVFHLDQFLSISS